MGVTKMLGKNRMCPAVARWGVVWALAVAAAAGLPAARDFATPASAADAENAPQKGFRRLAPGVLTVIPPRASSDSHAIRGDLYEVSRGLEAQAWTPAQAPAHTTLVERAKNREFQRDIWCL
jgi:hypothetical protein